MYCRSRGRNGIQWMERQLTCLLRGTPLHQHRTGRSKTRQSSLSVNRSRRSWRGALLKTWSVRRYESFVTAFPARETVDPLARIPSPHPGPTTADGTDGTPEVSSQECTSYRCTNWCCGGGGGGCGGRDVTVAKQHDGHLCDNVVGVE